jgi:hypothetical protein
MAFGHAMTTLPILGLGAVLCTAPALAADTGGATPPDPAAVTVAASVNRFASDLDGRLRPRRRGNLFFVAEHPTALAMTYAARAARRRRDSTMRSRPQDRPGGCRGAAAMRGGAGRGATGLDRQPSWGQRGCPSQLFTR